MRETKSQPGSLKSLPPVGERRDLHYPDPLVAPIGSSVTGVLGTLFHGFRLRGITEIFDPNLEMKTTLTGKVVSTGSKLNEIWPNYQELKNRPSYPILSWNREPINFTKYLGMRGSYKGIVQVSTDDEGVLDVYAGAVCSIKINWRYFTQNIAQMEQFEILYASQHHIRDFKYIDMVFFDQGPFKYEILWDDTLSSLTSADDNIAYISVGGTCTITGPMIIIMGPKVPRLNKILFRLYVTSASSPLCEVPMSTLVDKSVLIKEEEITE